MRCARLRIIVYCNKYCILHVRATPGEVVRDFPTVSTSTGNPPLQKLDNGPILRIACKSKNATNLQMQLTCMSETGSPCVWQAHPNTISKASKAES